MFTLAVGNILSFIGTSLQILLPIHGFIGLYIIIPLVINSIGFAASIAVIWGLFPLVANPLLLGIAFGVYTTL